MIKKIYKILISLINYVLNLLHLNYDFYELLFNIKKSRPSVTLNLKHKTVIKPGIVDNLNSKAILFLVPNSRNIKTKYNFIEKSRYFYEISQTLSEINCKIDIHFFYLPQKKNWIDPLIALLKSYKIDYIFLQAERDPDLVSWSLDKIVKRIRQFWDGTFIYILYDSYFTLHMYQIKRLIRIDRGKKVVIALDQNIGMKLPIKSQIRHIGPSFLPISMESLRFYDSQLGFDISKDDRSILLSFIGEIYPYRQELLNNLKKRNLAIQVNPQITNGSTVKSSYIDYLRALSNSVFTLNFSRSHVDETYQLKSRVLEAACYGCIIITDENEKISQFLEENVDFIYIKNFDEVIRVVEDYQEDPKRYSKMRISAFKKARSYLYRGFWNSLKL